MAKRANNPWQERFCLSYDHPAPGVAAGPVAATASFVCVANASMADSDYITIGDGGLNPALSFEYDKAGDGVTGGRVAVTVATTDITVADSFVAAINAAQLAVTASNAGGTSATVTLTHDVPGTIGNAATLTENVANAGFTVSGATFSGGAAADTTGATAAIKLMTAQRPMRIEKVEYINPTGLAGHASNYWEIALKKGSTVMAQWSTDSDVAGQGTLTANAIVNPVLSGTDANLVAAVGDVLSLALTKVASAANLPPGRLVVHGRYV
jgi:hypothetical protein